MYQIDFGYPVPVHFIGIGGISMSGLAEVLFEKGFPVSGSDSHESELTRRLASRGIRIIYGQSAANITDEIEAVVYTAAVTPENPEYAECVRRGLPMLSRAELLGQLMKNYHTAVAISGTHGKTTTTSMLTEILLKADYDPTVSVGGMLDSIGGNIRIGKADCFVTEACEYTNSFLSFYPTISAILNVEEDHLDFFKDIEDIRHSFHRFAQLLPEDGLLVIHHAIDRLSELTGDLRCQVETYGIEDDSADYVAKQLEFDWMARATYDLYYRGVLLGQISLGVPGEHNVGNSMAAIAIARRMGVPMEHIRKALQEFGGIHRRFEKKGVRNGVTVMDDYAHHPQEIAATLSVAGKCPHNKIWCVFQPHTYTRTKAFLKEFARALSMADEVVLADIYAARETDTLGISSQNLKEELDLLGTSAHYFSSFEEIENFLLEHCVNGDMLITMGAGDIVKVGENLLQK